MNALITIATPEIAEAAAPFLENQRLYAERWGYDYRVGTEKLLQNRHPSFSKIPLILKTMDDGAEWIVWADSDLAFTNFTRDIKEIVESKLVDRPELFLSAKIQHNWPAWQYLNAGLMLIRTTDYARSFFEEILDRCINGCPDIQPGRRTVIEGHPFENWHFDAMNRKTQFHGIYGANGYEIGSFCDDIWSDGDRWMPGYLTLHFAGPADWERRAQLFTEKYQPLIVQ